MNETADHVEPMTAEEQAAAQRNKLRALGQSLTYIVTLLALVGVGFVGVSTGETSDNLGTTAYTIMELIRVILVAVLPIAFVLMAYRATQLSIAHREQVQVCALHQPPLESGSE